MVWASRAHQISRLLRLLWPAMLMQRCFLQGALHLWVVFACATRPARQLRVQPLDCVLALRRIMPLARLRPLVARLLLFFFWIWLSLRVPPVYALMRL